MKQRVLLTACILMSGCSILWAQKFTAENAEGVKIKYEVISPVDKSLRVISVSQTENLVIPEVVQYKGTDYTVHSIGKWFIASEKKQNYKTLKVTLPSSLRTIEEKAFCNCLVLKDVNIPEGVTEIQDEAFATCQSLTSVVIPEGVEKIGNRAFMTYTKTGTLKGLVGTIISVIPNPPDNFKSISIPNSVKSIGTYAFGKGIYDMGTLNMSYETKDWFFGNLPPLITSSNCESFGISKSSYNKYMAGLPNGDAQQTQENLAQQMPSPNRQNVKTEAPSSDVDIDIPQGTGNNENTFAVIFANENYQEEVKVEYALNDGETFKTYCQKVLGLPEDNIHIRKDATLNNIKAEMSWLQKVAEAYKGQARFIIYYAGHGIPDEKTGTSYLLPIDGKGSMLETGYSLKDFYNQLGEMPSAGVTVFMDACFSGSKRGDGMLASARGVAIKAKPQAPQGKMVVFSAAQGDETAYPFKEKEHGLFTYYLLKKLKETSGNVSLGELGQFITDQVSRKSIVTNGKSQTPTIVPSGTIGDSWKSMKLK